MNRWLFMILSKVIMMASPQILEDLRKRIQEMVERAAVTENPWDDIFVGMIQMMVGKPGDDTKDRNDFR